VTTLNPQQRAAVRYIDGPLLVLAGAGSGKTSVITRKIAWLIEECGYEARHIAAVTFTNKAAREMKERAAQLLKDRSAKGLTVSTFHNLGLNIIRSSASLLGRKSGFSIFDADDSQVLLKELMLRGDDLDPDLLDMVKHQISAWKNELLSPQQVMGQAENAREVAMAHLYERYQQALKTYNAVDFDDLILLPVELFQTHPEVLEKWRRRIRYLLVDEYQDTNLAQYRLVKLLVEPRRRLTVVGDDDQSIYAWRGARPENLVQLQEDFPELQIIKLEQNYRSTARILRSANHLIDHNPHVFSKSLWSELGLGDPIRIIRSPNEEAECERVVNEILDLRLKRRCQFRDFAVLYRGNHQARLLEMKLQAQGVPYQMSGGTSFFARQEIKDLLGYLRLIINPDDDNAFLRIINTPRRQIGPSTLEKVAEYANQREISLLKAIGEFGLQSQLGEQPWDHLQRFKHWFEGIVRQCSGDNPIDAIHRLLDDIDYASWLHQNASSARVAENRMANVLLLVDQLRNSLARMDDDDDNAMESAISKLLLRDLMERQEEESADDKVHLMTLHSAKGLEFPHVFMIGMEEGLLPHRVSIDENNIEEERRLAYVGVTRAQRTLTLTLTASRKQFGETFQTIPSRFIDELPEADIEREGFGESNEETRRTRARESLDALKDLFA